MNRLILFVTGALLLIAAPAFPAGGSPESGPSVRAAADRLYRGLYREIALGEPAAAAEIYRSIAADSGSGPRLAGRAAVRLGICLEKMGKVSDAIECYQRALDEYRDFPLIREQVSEGLVRLYAGLPAETEEKEAIPLPALISRGLGALDGGNPVDAREAFREALALDPQNRYLQFLMAQTCRELGEHQEAIYYYNQIIKSPEYQNNFAAYRDLAKCYRAAGIPEEGIRLWGIYSRKNDTEDKTRVEYELHLLTEAVGAGESETIPGELQGLLDLGEARTREGHYKEAAEVYSRARQLYPESWYPPYRLAFLSEHFQNKPRVAVWYYKEAVKKAPARHGDLLRSRIDRLKEAETKK
ncbi:MAG: tetratricopeptide repeat protein [PVC group bacterium]